MVQTNLHFVTGKSVVKTGHVETNLFGVGPEHVSKVQRLESGEPGRPEGEPRHVVKKVTVDEASPVKDRFNSLCIETDENVLVQQITVHDVQGIRTVRESIVERPHPSNVERLYVSVLCQFTSPSPNTRIVVVFDGRG